jgi:hypothetical protein
MERRWLQDLRDADVMQAQERRRMTTKARLPGTKAPAPKRRAILRAHGERRR